VWVTFLLAAAFVFAAFVAAALFVPLTVAFNAQARGEPSGAWAVACGLAVGPLAFSMVAAAGVPMTVSLHVFGWRLAEFPLRRWLATRTRTRAREAPGRAEAEAEQNAFERVFGTELGGFDWVEVGAAVWSEKHRVRLLRTEVDLAYSFRDVALTGQLLGAVYAFSALLPPQVRVRQTPSWDANDRLLVGVDGRFRVALGLLALDGLRFVLRKRLELRRLRLARGTS
jgi:hypothetical protein